MLVDTTECLGCRKCEYACDQAHHLTDQPLESFETLDVFDQNRRISTTAYTVVNRTPNPENSEQPTYVKIQCMHCLDPACVSACLVGSLQLQTDGSVTYDAWKCIGCRYCMVACPFEVIAYEYPDPLTPEVRKCDFCFAQRSQEDQLPACAEICPPMCLTFGKRSALLELAHQKIKAAPERYVEHVYGETEVGGTAWLYMAGQNYNKLGFLTYGDEPIPTTTEAIQHSVFKYGAPPLVLYGLLAGSMWAFKDRNRKEIPVQQTPESLEQTPEPLAGRFWTPYAFLLLLLSAMGCVACFYRFTGGLGAVTNLTDSYPWGIWKAVNVAAGVALATSSFTTSALVHIFHRKRFAPVLRPALLIGLLGYTFGALSLFVDIGRYYNIWHPAWPSMWQGDSVLFEVAICIMCYLALQYIEFIPVVWERFSRAVDSRSRGNNDKSGVHLLLSALLVLGAVLSCLHHSSLGSLMLIAPYKMHPLWYTPALPLLFLMSIFAVGFAVVICESLAVSWGYRRRVQMEILSPLSLYVLVFLGLYAIAKICDLMIRGVSILPWDGNPETLFFLAEVLPGILIPFAMLLSRRVRSSPLWLGVASGLVVFGVLLNRVNVFITAFHASFTTERYFPSFSEIVITIGLLAVFLFLHRAALFVFPILSINKEYPLSGVES